MIGYGYSIILGCTDGELFVSTLGSADRNTIGLDEGTDLGSSYVFFDGSNKVKPVGLLFGEAFGSDNKSVLGRLCDALEKAKDSMLEG